MRFTDVQWLGLTLSIVLAGFLAPMPAQAQAYPCPGPGPGERMVGMTQAGNGVASVPLCVSDESEAPAAPAALIYIYAAIAWHADADDFWVDGNYTGPGSAERGALAMCNAVMGSGCTSSGEWSNSSIAVIRDRNGYFYGAWLGDGKAERDRLLRECSAKQPLPCETVATVRSSTNRRSPGAGARKVYAASAWVDGLEGDDKKLYVASGYRGADAATEAAVKACKDATTRPCVANAFVGNGFIQAFHMGDKGYSATAETSAKRAQQAARAVCKKQKSASCELRALFDSRKPGLFVEDFASTGAP